MTIEFLLRRAAGTGDARALAMACRTLDAMADGGIHDQLGGGFHRYATDAVWLVPHFEQMLYDNAQLARTYIHAWRLTGDARYREAAIGALDYLARELRPAEGGFAASQDADTEGVEGGTFVWTPEEVRGRPRPGRGDPVHDRLRRHRERQLGGPVDPPPGPLRRRPGRAARARPPTTVTAPGREPGPPCSPRAAPGPSRPATTRSWPPGTGWRSPPWPTRRACAATGTRRAGRRRAGAGTALAVARARPQTIRPRAAPARPTVGSAGAGRTVGPRADGVLEDHAGLAEGLLALYEATFDERWFVAARGLADTILDRFADPAGGFFDTSDDHEALVTRPKDLQDNAVPSGNAMAATVLLRLAALTGDGALPDRGRARRSGSSPELAGRYPTGFAQWLVAIDFALAPTIEVAVVGDPADPVTRRLAAPARTGFRPHLVIAISPTPRDSAIELMGARFQLGDRPTAFVCREFACRQPVNEPEALAAQLLAT